MNIIVTILLILLGIIVLLLIIGLFMKKSYYIQRDILINAPLQKVFDYIKLQNNHDHFNKWREDAMTDTNMKRTYTGTDGTVGFIYGWNGNSKAGEGELEIKAIEEGKRIDSEIRFVRPFVTVGHLTMTTEAISDNQTRVSWSNSSAMKYPLNIMVPMVEKMLPKDMDISLGNLKRLLEK